MLVALVILLSPLPVLIGGSVVALRIMRGQEAGVNVVARALAIGGMVGVALGVTVTAVLLATVLGLRAVVR